MKAPGGAPPIGDDGLSRAGRNGQTPSGDAASGAPPLPPNRIEVARAGDVILVRVLGLGSVNNAPLLGDFAVKALTEGSCRFAFDLAECRGLDSTFLGAMVGIAQEAAELAGKKGWVCVFNVSDANRELFEIVGADKYVRCGSYVAMEPIETHPLVGKPVSQEKRLEIVRRAHENLLKIDERNEARFGEFLRCLAAEMAKTDRT